MKKSAIVFITVIFVLMCLIMTVLLSRSVVTMKNAVDLYNSFAWPKIAQQDVFDSDKLLKNYKYTKASYGDHNCYIFDIKDSNMKLYSFLMPNCNDVFLFQMVLVNEDFLKRDDVFEIGSNINSVKQKYPDIVLLKNDHIYFDFDKQPTEDESTAFSGTVKYYFEILNSKGLYSYGLNEEQNIVVKFKFGFDTMEWVLCDK